MTARGRLGLVSLLGTLLGPLSSLLLGTAGCGARTALWEARDGVAGAPFGVGGNSGGSAGAAGHVGGGTALGGTSNNGDAGSGATAGASMPWTVSGAEKLVDLFVGKLGIYVVFDDSVVLLRRSNGEILTRVPTKGRAISAAFDGEYLSVAIEGALIVTYSLDLNSQFVTQTSFDCQGLALVSEHRGVCGSSIPALAVYDVLGGAQLGSLGMGSGASVQRIPGSDDVLVSGAVGGTQIYGLTDVRVATDGSLAFVGNFNAIQGRAYGFDGAPATRLVNGLGQIFELECATEPCPVSRLKSDQPGQFIAFDSVAPNETFALHDAAPNSASDDDKTYTIALLDVIARQIVVGQAIAAVSGFVVALRRDPRSQSVLIGTRSNPGGGGRGYQLHSVSFAR